MRYFVGKLKEVSLAANPSSAALSVPRVPISSVAFCPLPSPEANGEYLLLTAGGSAVALWNLSLAAVPDAVAIKTESTKERILETTEKQSRWLHAEAASPQAKAERLGFFSEHAPEYVTRVQWSADGSRWASADGKRVIVFTRKCPNDETSWQRQHCILEPAVQEIFDFSLIMDRLVIGGFGRAVIRTLPDVHPDTTLVINLEEGEFVKGIATRQSSNDAFLICLATSHKSALIYTYNITSQTLMQLMIDRTLFSDGPSDHPGLRYASIDPTGRLAAFAYGARKHDTFGAMFDLREMQRARMMNADIESHPEEERDAWHKKIEEVIAEAKYRIRGHLTRINCVAFGNCVKSLGILPSDFVRHSKNESMRPQVRHSLIAALLKTEEQCLQDSRWPKYVMYAQASIEGLLSVWEIFISSKQDQTVSGICLTATPQMLVDQTGLITCMDWSIDDRLLVVGSDDGKLSCVIFQNS